MIMKNSGNDGKLAISIYVQADQIRIHQSVLKVLGAPKFIHLGVDEQKMRFMVLGKWVKQERAIRVPQNGQNSFVVCSKALIEEIRRASSMFQEPCSYRLKGQFIPAEDAVIFPLETMEHIEKKRVK